MTQSTLKRTNPRQFRGRVEVCVGRRYGTICDNW